MAVKVFEMVAKRIDLGKAILAGLDTYHQDIAGYGRALAVDLEEGETPVDADFQVTLLRRRVARNLENVRSLDSGVLLQVHDDDQIRLEIVSLSDAVDGKLRRVRHTTKGVYSAESLARVGLKGEFPRRPAALYERGRVVQASLRSPDMDLRPVFVLKDGEEAVVRPTQLADELEPELTDLGRALDVQRADAREAADVRSRRRQVLREFDQDIRAVVRTTQGLLRLAGRPDLAKRFRSTLPRISRRSVEQGEEEGNVTETTTP